MKLLPWSAGLALCALVSFAAAPAAMAQQDKLDKADTAAMKKLAQANHAEIELGKLAQSKAQSEEVKKFGQHMVDEHGQMLEDLQKLASSKGVTLPDSPAAKDQKTLKKLQGLSGAQFDRRYMADMVKDHKKDIQETAKIAQKAKDAEFKSAVQQANSKMKEHLQMAQQVASTTKSASRGSSSSGSKK
ncbi:MAG TPA: DUF4142 domain-containing protein [Burkholderiales bacterium]|nr:DUF4142 domain-containing protein [Burkholderiales bacterium]